MAETLTLTTWDDWVAAAGSLSRLAQYAQGDTQVDHPRVEAAEALAIEEAATYLRKRYGAAALVAPLSPLVKSQLIDLGMGYLTRYADQRSDNIAVNMLAARAWFVAVSNGKGTLADAVAPSGERPESVTGFYSSTEPSTFDFSDPRSPASIRMPKL